MSTYVPGTLETDQKKINQSIQQIWQSQQTDETNITALQNSRASSSTFGLVEVDGTTITAAAGVISNSTAAKADQTAATSTTKSVTPSTQQFHPSAIKAWVKFTGSTTNGNQTIGDSYNVTSVSRTSAGFYTVTFTTSFASANYCCAGSSHAGGSVNALVQFTSLATGSVSAEFVNLSGPAVYDPTLGASLIFVGTE